MIKFCQKCKDKNGTKCSTGYSFWWKDEIRVCPNCSDTMIDIDFPASDLATILETSKDVSFVEAMIDLKQKDPIDYNLKISQFRIQVQQQQNLTQQESNAVKCIYCNSTNTKKISATSKVGSAAMWGLFSVGKLTKQWHCNDCGSNF